MNASLMNASVITIMRREKCSTTSFCIFLALFTTIQSLAQEAHDNRAEIVSLFKMARQAEQRGDFKEAVKCYDQILKLDARIGEVWTNRGLCLYELNKHGEAVKSFAKAAALNPRLAMPHLFLGIEYLRLGEPDKAASSLQTVLSLEPNHPQATYELANTYVQLERFEQARELYQQLLRRDPNMEEARYRLGIAYLNWSRSAARKLLDSPNATSYGKILLAELQAVAGLLEDAETNFRSAVASQPELVEARLALGQFYLTSQVPARTAESQQQLAKAQELDPRNLQTELALIRLNLLHQDFSGASKRLENLLRVDLPFVRRHLSDLGKGLTPDVLTGIIKAMTAVPDDKYHESGGALGKVAAQAFLYSADLESDADEQAGAALHNFDILAQALNLSPLDASYSRRSQQLQRQVSQLSVADMLDLAVISWNLGDHDGALANLLAVLHGAPSDQALYWLCRTCQALARETFEEAIARNPGSYRAHLLLADLAKQNHDTVKALAEYGRAVSAGNGDPEVHLLFIQFLTGQARIPEALERARIAVEKFPAHPALNGEFGKLLLKTGKPQEAIHYFQASLQADSSSGETRAALADAYAASGELAKAIQEMKPALPGDKDGSFHYRLGRWYQKMGQTSAADAAFAMASKLKEARREAERSKLSLLQPNASVP
jgi:tetratricopeptide (TPR) repeat protein